MAHYNLIFQGKIVDGASLDEVKNNVARLFKADAAKTAVLFSGKSIVIKKNLDSESTKKYLAIMKKSGAIIHAVKIEEDPVSSHSTPIADTAINNNESQDVATQSPKPQTASGLSAGLASLTNYNQSTPASEAPAPKNDIDNPNDGLQLAPVGSAVLAQPTKDDATEIPDISHLTMSEAETGSLEEFAHHAKAVDLPNIDSLTMSDANTGSLAEFAIKAEPVELPDISELDMAEQDNTPLSDGVEKASPVEIPDTSDITMSEAQEGTLEGIEKTPKPVKIPDISHISTEPQDKEVDKKEKITGKATFKIN